MMKAWMRGRTVVAVVAALTMAAGAGVAYAADTSVLNFEGQTDLGAGGGHLESCGNGSGFSCGPGDFTSIVEANEALMGIDIDPIGKFDEGLGTVDISDPFSPDGGLTSPFAGATGTVEIAEVNGVQGLLFTIDLEGDLANAWSIVKIVVKQGTADGNFVAFGEGSVIADPSTTVLKAFIPETQYNFFDAPGGLDLSHWTAFGTRSSTTVPEPATLMFLGLGLVGVGIAARSRRK